jgi:ribonuclease J
MPWIGYARRASLRAVTAALRVVPLGGLGEIGMNLLVLETPRAAIAIDCGVMFPDASMLGVDVVLPDTTYLDTLGERLQAIFLTHAHEDHIGALPYVLPAHPVPVYGTPLARAFVRERLAEHGVGADLRGWDDAPIHVGDLAVTPFAMTHSIPEAVGFAIESPVGTIVHTGDFKIDHTPLDGRGPDLARLAALGDAGVTLLLSDSTNVEHEGVTASESTVGPHLEPIFAETTGRVVVTTFSSHMHRIQQVVDLALRHGRRLAFVGRSLVSHARVARDLGVLRVPDGVLVDAAAIGEVPPRQLALVTAGSQAEATSALVRIAMDQDKQVKLEPGDAVVLSARVIPGNERAIGHLVDHLYRRGATVYYGRNVPVHVSGHAARDELRLVLGLVRPRHFVPVHGEYRHLRRHALLAAEMGVAREQCHLLEDGDVLEMGPDGVGRGEPVPAGRVFVDGRGVGEVETYVLRDRRHMAADGVIVVVAALAGHGPGVTWGPELLARGVVAEEAGAEVLDGARAAVVAALETLTREEYDDVEAQDVVRRTVRRYFRRLDRRPLVIPFVFSM